MLYNAKHVLLMSTLAVAATHTSGLAAQSTDYSKIIANRLYTLVGPSAATLSKAAKAQSSLNGSQAKADLDLYNTEKSKTGTRNDIFADYPFPNDVPATFSHSITMTYRRLAEMATAYADPNSAYYNNADMKAAILDALDWMSKNAYTSSGVELTYTYTDSTGKQQKTTSNWWDWEIGAPLALNDTLVLMGSAVAATDIATYAQNEKNYIGKSTGDYAQPANYLWEMGAKALTYALLSKSASADDNQANSNDLTSSLNKVPDQFSVVTGTSDGFHGDYSFTAHGSHPYTGGYATGMVQTTSILATELQGTAWQFSTSFQNRVATLLLNGFKPFVHKGEMADIVRGRTIAEYYSQGYGDESPAAPPDGSTLVPTKNIPSGRQVASIFIQFAQLLNGNSDATSSQNATALQQAAKYWLQQDTTLPSTLDYLTSLDETIAADALLSNNSVPAMKDADGFTPFADMDIFVEHNSGIYAVLALYSSRIRNYEALNGETATPRTPPTAPCTYTTTTCTSTARGTGPMSTPSASTV